MRLEIIIRFAITSFESLRPNHFFLNVYIEPGKQQEREIEC